MLRKFISRKDDSGAAHVEFALSMFMVLVAILTLLELCGAVYTYVMLSDAANEGLRYAIVRSSDGSFVSHVQTQVTTYAGYSVHNMTNLNVSVSCPDASGGTCPGSVPGRVKVSVSYTYVPYIGTLIGVGNNHVPTMHAFAEGRLIY